MKDGESFNCTRKGMNSEQRLLFDFLSRVDYDQSLEVILHDVGYNLGDWRFEDMPTDKIIALVKHLWIELHTH